MTRHRAPAVLAIATAVALVAGACAGSPGASTPAAGATTLPGGSPAGGGIPLDSIVVTGTVEMASAASGTITMAAGGSISATGSDGSTYALQVPAGAVAEETEVTLTPLTGVRVMEGGGPVYAVDLQPEGLQFFGLARLTITPAAPIPVEQQLAFTASDDGRDIELALVDPTSEPVVLLLEHFTKGGLGQFTPEQQAAMKAKSAANAQRRISGEIRDLIKEEREKQLLGEPPQQPDVSALLAEFQTEVVDKLKEAAALSCDQLLVYVKSLISFQRQLELLGRAAADAYAAAMAEVARIALERYPACEQEAKDRCIAEKDPGILVRFWLANTEAKVQAGQPVGAEMQARAEKICKPEGFQFHFAGSGNGDPLTAGLVTYEYWGLRCADEDKWRVWEFVHDDAGTEATGEPGKDVYGPLTVTFDAQGAMVSASWPPTGASPAGYLLHKTRLTLLPSGDAPTKVTASIAAGSVPDLRAEAPVEPFDGSFSECPPPS